MSPPLPCSGRQRQGPGEGVRRLRQERRKAHLAERRGQGLEPHGRELRGPRKNDRRCREVPPAAEPPAEAEQNERGIAFEEASKEGKFDLRPTIGGLWSKEIAKSGELKEAYKSLGKSYQAQMAFRVRWAAAKASQLRHERIQSNACLDIDEEGFAYLPISRMVVLEGGDEAAKVAVRNLVCKLIEMQQQGVTTRSRAPIVFNDFTLRHDFAYVRKSFAHRVEQKWVELCTKGGLKSSDPSAQGATSGAKFSVWVVGGGGGGTRTTHQCIIPMSDWCLV